MYLVAIYNLYYDIINQIDDTIETKELYLSYPNINLFNLKKIKTLLSIA